MILDTPRGEGEDFSGRSFSSPCFSTCGAHSYLPSRGSSEPLLRRGDAIREGRGGIVREVLKVCLLMDLISPWLSLRQSSSVSSCCRQKVPLLQFLFISWEVAGIVIMVGFKATDVPPTATVKFLGAGTAACIADLITFPRDTAKVRLQVSG